MNSFYSSNTIQITNKTHESLQSHMKNIEKNEEIYSKESDRLKEMYHTLQSHHINQIFRDKISEFYESFSLHLDKILLENKDLKQMLKALYHLHMTKTTNARNILGDQKENLGENFVQRKNSDFSKFKVDLKRKYKDELINVRETMGGQIKKLEKELAANLKLMRQLQKKNKNKIKGLEVERISYEGRVQETREMEMQYMRESMKKEYFMEKSQIFEEFQKKINSLEDDKKTQMSELINELVGLKKNLEILEIEKENLNLKAEGDADRIETKDNIIEKLRKEISKRDSIIEILGRKLKKSESVVNKQTEEVNKLIKELQERKFEIKNGLKLDFGEVQQRSEIQQQILDKLQQENIQLREKNELEISMIRKDFERRMFKIKEKAGLMLEREEETELQLVSLID